MKKILPILLILAMLFTLAACGGTETTAPTTSGTTGTGTTAAPTTTEAGPPAKVIMTYLTQGFTPTDMLDVVAEINKTSVAKINVEVEFLPISIMELFTGKYSVMIGSGERMDLMMLAFQNPVDYVENGSLEELDELLANNAPTIMSLKDEYPITLPATVNGKIYGVTPLSASYGTQFGYIFRKDWFEETGTAVKDMYTMDEIGDILAKVKAKHPETYPMCITVGGGTMSASSLGMYFPYDSLGATAASGVLMDFNSTKVVNGFESQEFYNTLLTIRKWFEAGYIPQDAATTTETIFTLGPAGVCGAYPMIMEPVQTSTTKASFGWESVALPTTVGFNGSLARAGANWTVPITAEEPAAAIKFLDLMYSDHNVHNTILWGIEGKHYVKSDVEQVIKFPEGVDGTNSGYYNTFGLYGDRRFELQWNVMATKPYTDAYHAQNMKNTYKSKGYAFDSSEFNNQIVAINTVAGQYLPTLLTGSSADVRGLLDKMIADMKVAGIDDVIAANQSQFDAWLAKK